LHSRQTHIIRSGRNDAWQEPALAPNGTLAVVDRSYQAGSLQFVVVLANPRTGTMVRTVGPGELPAWSHDGKTLFYVRRITGKLLHMFDSVTNPISSQTYTSEIWRTDSEGKNGVRLLRQDAFGLGPLQVMPDNHILIFSHVDNAWNL